MEINTLLRLLKIRNKLPLLRLFEYAFMCSDIYQHSIDEFLKSINEKRYLLPINTWLKRLSDDELKSLNLNPRYFIVKKYGFYSGLYFNQRANKYVLVFRGTEGRKLLKGKKQIEAIKDWKYGNDPQTIGKESPQYTKAMKLSEHILKNLKQDFTITGHSLGGGLASASSIIANKKAVVFNSAGLHNNTIKRYTGNKKFNKWKYKNQITNYYIPGEIVTGSQRFGKVFLSILSPILGPLAYFIIPNAIGRFIKIKPVNKFKTPMQKHQMSQIIESLMEDVFIKMW